MAQGLTTPDRSLEQVDSEFPGAEAWLQWKATKRGFAKVLENQSDRLARIGASLFYRTCLAICAGNLWAIRDEPLLVRFDDCGEFVVHGRMILLRVRSPDPERP